MNAKTPDPVMLDRETIWLNLFRDALKWTSPTMLSAASIDESVESEDFPAMASAMAAKVADEGVKCWEARFRAPATK